MKKLLMILVSMSLLMPLYAQETETAEQPEVNEDELLAEGLEEEGEEAEPEPAKPFTYAREKFEFGYDLGIGFDNDFISMGNLFKKEIVINLDKVDDILGEDGLNINVDGEGGIFVNIMNFDIYGGVWDFGFFSGVEGGINFNVPQSLFTLISEGNIKKHSSSGMISASGAVFSNTGVRASAKYGKLRLGARPTLYTPIIFIPKSGIDYRLETEEEIELTTSGTIDIYSPVGEDGEFTGLKFGLDMTFEGEYELFPFLSLGGTFSGVPIAPAKLENRMRLTMSDVNFHISGEELMDGDDISTKIPDFDSIEFDESYDKTAFYVFRPLRFDVYAHYNPYKNDLLAVIVRPNIGFSVDINNKEGFFNAGAEGQLNIKDMFVVHLGTGYEESIWKHRLGFLLNFRAFEFYTEAALRSSDFGGSFTAQGFGLQFGMHFGW